MARASMLESMAWAAGYKKLNWPGRDSGPVDGALGDCVRVYGDAGSRLARLVHGEGPGAEFSNDDAVTWLSAALASHTTCLDGMVEKGLLFEARRARNLTRAIREALADYRAGNNRRGKGKGNFVLSSYFWLLNVYIYHIIF